MMLIFAIDSALAMAVLLFIDEFYSDGRFLLEPNKELDIVACDGETEKLSNIKEV